MKKLIIGFAIAASTLAACNSSNNKPADAKTNEVNNNPSIPNDDSKILDNPPVTNTSFPTKEIIAGYLQLKNALAKDNSNDASIAGNTIVALLEKVDKASLSSDKMKAYADLQDDLEENAEHIGANAGKLEHQREHFEMLSNDMADLIKTFGNGGQTLYKDFCPMFNKGKGAYWISEIKEIKNPYLGGKMPTCGMIKETIQ